MDKNTAITRIVQKLRQTELQTVPRTEYERNRQHFILSYLDLAESKSTLYLALDVRSLAYATGIDEHTSCAIRNSLASRDGSKRLISEGRHHPRHADQYAVNPVFPLVCESTYTTMLHLGVSRERAKLTRFGLADGETLLQYYSEPSNCHVGEHSKGTRIYTLGGYDRRLALLIGRTNLGIHLGKTKTAVLLSLRDSFGTMAGGVPESASIAQKVRYLSVASEHWEYDSVIAKRANVSVRVARESLRYLHKIGLAERARANKRHVWKTGTPIGEYDTGNLPDVVGTRLKRWAKDREAWALEHPITYDEIMASLESDLADAE